VDRGDLFDALNRDVGAQIKTVIHMGACADTTQADVDFSDDVELRVLADSV
jgi:hypothetical protein